MKLKLTLIAAIVALCAIVIPGLASAGGEPPPSPCFDITLDNPSGPNKVSLCHFTGGTNIVLNMPSVSALDSHISHHGDCYRLFNEPQVCIL